MRFPGFEGDWNEATLNELCERIGDGLHGTPEYTEHTSYYFINGSNLLNGKISITETTKEVSVKEWSANNKNLSSKSLFISINGTIGNVALYNNENIMLGKSVAYLNFRSGNDFFYYALVSNKIQNYFSSQLTGTTIKNLSLKTIRETKLLFPNGHEKNKIASFLSSIDIRIQTQSKIIRELKSLKSTVSKQIFTQQLKFKDSNGKYFPNWKSGKLADISIINMGQSPSSNSYNTEKIGLPLIQGNADILDRVTNPRNWTTETTKTCKSGDLILTVRAPVGAVAKCTHYACIGRGVCAISEISDNTLEFIYQFLLEYENKWGAIEQGSTFTAVSGEEIKKIKLGIPCIQEQIKIGEFLSKMDKEIETEHKVLQQFESQKQYLLSNLFI